MSLTYWKLWNFSFFFKNQLWNLDPAGCVGCFVAGLFDEDVTDGALGEEPIRSIGAPVPTPAPAPGCLGGLKKQHRAIF